MPEKLIRLVRKNSRKAQHEFYKRYSIQMFRLTYRYVNNEQDAGSIVNSGFFKIFNNIDKFKYKDERSFIAWMKRIVINEALIFLRSKHIYEELQASRNDVFSNDNILENNLLLEDYYNMIKSLPDDLRTVFNLYAIDGFSHKEVADKLNIQESSSRVYLTRARKILQQKLTLN